MPQEFEYFVTRICLRRGALSLPPNMVELFAGSDSHQVSDTMSDLQLDVALADERMLTGLAPFFEQHDLRVNDTVIIRRAADGLITFTARARRRKPDWSAPEASAHIVQQLADAGPVTDAEARTLLPDLPADYDLAALLQQDGRLQLHAGRWQKPEQAAAQQTGVAQPQRRPEQQPQQPQQPSPQRNEVQSAVPAAVAAALPAESRVAEEGSASEDAAQASRIFSQLGFVVTAVTTDVLLLDSQLDGGSFKVLAQLVGGKLDWITLLEQRDQAGADCVALIGAAADLLKLSAPAGLAEARLWSWAGLLRVADYSQSVPISPLDLESHFRNDGMFEAGLERFEQVMTDRIGERGAFSTVLTRLAALPGPAAFQLTDVSGDASKEHAERVLEQLTRSPFQLVVQKAPGRYYLRGSVSAALKQLGDYAESLLQRLPAARIAAPAPTGRRVEREELITY